MEWMFVKSLIKGGALSSDDILKNIRRYFDKSKDIKVHLFSFYRENFKIFFLFIGFLLPTLWFLRLEI